MSKSGDLTVMNLQFQDEVAIIKLQNGKNVINRKFIHEMDKALDLVLENEAIQLLVTASEGKFFSNGLDLASIYEYGPEGAEEFMNAFNALCARLITFPMPTIAAINGHAFAGGMLLAMSHDYRVMNHEKGWLCMNEVFMPSRLPPFLLQLLKHKLPSGVTQTEVTSLGVRFTGPEAQQAGIVQATVPKEKLLSTAVQLGRKTVKYGKIGRLSLNVMKVDQYRPLLDMLGKFDNVLPQLEKYIVFPKSRV